MKTLFRLVPLLLSLPTLCACTTMNFAAYSYKEVGPSETVSVTPNGADPWKFDVSNRSNSDLMLNVGKSAFVLNGESYRVVTGDSKIGKMDEASADLPIAAGSKKQVVFLPPELLNVKYDDGFKIEWIKRPSDGDKYEFKFVFSNDSGKVVRSAISGTIHAFDASTSKTNKYVCWGTAIIYGGWCWFLPTDNDIATGVASARKKFGEKTVVEYRGRSM